MRKSTLTEESLAAIRSVPRDRLVPEDAPERFIDAFVDALDLKALGFVDRRRPNQHAAHPVDDLLKCVLFGAASGVITCRALEKACATNVSYLFLCHCDSPGKSSFSRFFCDNRAVVPPLLDVLVQRAAEVGIVGMDLHALDGTKMRAASSMHTAVHRDVEKKRLQHLDKRIERLEDQLSALPAQELRYQLERAKTQRQETLEHIALLDKHGTDHIHTNETDARVMRCDPRPLLAYNGQIVVDHESDMIVAIGLSAEETDHAQLVPMLEQTRERLGKVAKATVIDMGYTSGEQLHEAHRRHLPVLGPVQPEWDKGLLPKSAFGYDQERDVVICPRGEELPLEDRRKMTKDAAHDTSIYRCHNLDCPERAACTSDRKGRTVKRTPFDEDLERMRCEMAEPAKRNLSDLRKEIVEHIFGCIKSNDKHRRFTVRGLGKTFAQWALVCIALDLRKLYHAWVSGLFSWRPQPAACA